MARRPIIQPAVLTDGNLARENEASTAFAFPWPWASDRGLQYVQREEIKRAQGVNLMPAQWRPGQSILGQVKRLPVPVQLYRRSAKAAHLYRVYQNNCLIDDGSREMRSSVAHTSPTRRSLATRMLRRRLPVRTSSAACSFCTTAKQAFSRERTAR